MSVMEAAAEMPSKLLFLALPNQPHSSVSLPYGLPSLLSLSKHTKPSPPHHPVRTAVMLMHVEWCWTNQLDSSIRLIAPLNPKVGGRSEPMNDDSELRTTICIALTKEPPQAVLTHDGRSRHGRERDLKGRTTSLQLHRGQLRPEICPRHGRMRLPCCEALQFAHFFVLPLPPGRGRNGGEVGRGETPSRHKIKVPGINIACPVVSQHVSDVKLAFTRQPLRWTTCVS